MSSITPPADDAGLQSLRQNNKMATGVDSVNPIAAKPAIHQPTIAVNASKLHSEKRQQIDRRKKDRRIESKTRNKKNLQLDTRNHHDRRMSGRRNSEEKNAPHPRGVNVKV